MNNELQNNPVAKLVFDVLAERQRHRQRTDLNNLFRAMRRDNPDLSEREYLEVFKTLQMNGAGSLIIGRRGNPNRFIWKYNLKDLAEKIKTNGLNHSTIKHLELIKPEAKADEKVVKRAKRPSFKSKRILGTKVEEKPKARKKAIAVVKPSELVNEVKATPQGITLNINAPNLTASDLKALVEILTSYNK